jgi:hypothetical protein
MVQAVDAHYVFATGLEEMVRKAADLAANLWFRLAPESYRADKIARPQKFCLPLHCFALPVQWIRDGPDF